MQRTLIYRSKDEVIVVAAINPPYVFPPSLHELPWHSITLYVTTADILPKQRRCLCGELVALRPRWFVAAGYDCEKWHDTFDQALISQFAPDYIVPEDLMVLTSWHGNEPIEEVLFFTLFCGLPDDLGVHRYAILILGPASPDTERVIHSALMHHRPSLISSVDHSLQ